ncbi:MAG: MltA domain-containing protein [Tepidisphaeraceae bacterium]
MMRSRFPFALLLLLAAVAGCHQEAPPVDFRQPLPPGMVALRKISPAEYPDFGQQPIDAASLEASIDNSLQYLSAPSSQNFYPYLDITHERAVASLVRLKQICQRSDQRGAWDGAWFNQQIDDNFEVYESIGAPTPDGTDYTSKVLFTGYFTPIYDASLTRTADYQWPLYKVPPDLARNAATGQVYGRRAIDGSIVPYYTRAQIETGGKLAGDELVWLKSRWEAYVITVQGSARLRLADSGKIYEIGFAGTNGYTYTSPGEQMVADGVITQDQLSFKGLADYFAAHPDAMDKYLSINQRYVFFTERPGGPFGSLNVPVTPWATIATDKEQRDIYPRAMPAFVCVDVPQETGDGFRPLRSFLLDQDTGGAIRASGRCDIYMGIGPQAEIVAGHEVQQGTLYYLAIRPELMQAAK